MALVRQLQGDMTNPGADVEDVTAGRSDGRLDDLCERRIGESDEIWIPPDAGREVRLRSQAAKIGNELFRVGAHITHGLPLAYEIGNGLRVRDCARPAPNISASAWRTESFAAFVP